MEIKPEFDNVIVSSSVPKTKKVKKLLIIEEDSETTEFTLLASNWKKTKSFKSIQDKETQIKYYKKNNSCSFCWFRVRMCFRKKK